MDDPKESWNAKALEWNDWVGDEGDNNRRYNSDPVLWQMLGDVHGKDILDAGCGTGYLSFLLAQKGARVKGVDWASKMIELCRQKKPDDCSIDFQVDCCSSLETVADASMDLIVSNYVLMDLPDLEGAIAAFYRVLRNSGKAVLIFLHPCFDTPEGAEWLEDGSVQYRWRYSYFDKQQDSCQWGPFTTSFIGYHRPLSYYWKCFIDAGFSIIDFQEPIVPLDFPGLPLEKIKKGRMAPGSVAFLLGK